MTSASQVGFFKVDVNGAEPFVVYGARDTISRNLPVVVAELDAERIAAFKKDWVKTHQVRGGGRAGSGCWGHQGRFATCGCLGAHPHSLASAPPCTQPLSAA